MVLVPSLNLRHVAKDLAAPRADELHITKFVDSAMPNVDAFLTHSGLEHAREAMRQGQT